MGSPEEDDHGSGVQVEDGNGDDAPNAPASAGAKVPFEDTPSEAPLSTTSTWAEDSELRPGLNKVSVVDKGWKVKGKLAPRMSSLAEGTDDDDGLVHSGMPGAIQGEPCICAQSQILLHQLIVLSLQLRMRSSVFVGSLMATSRQLISVSITTTKEIWSASSMTLITTGQRKFDHMQDSLETRSVF